MARGILLGLVMATVCGSVAAGPPGLQPNPHAEGRELDPVARDFHLTPEPPAPECASSSVVADGSALWAILLSIHEAIATGYASR